MRCLRLAAIVALAGLAASCGAPPMKPYAYPQYGFTADFQAPPKVEDTPGENGGRLVVVDARTPGRDFAVSISDVAPGRDIDALEDAASQSMIKANGGVVTYRTYCSTAEGVLGREEAISKNGEAVVRVRFYLSGSRFYILAATSNHGLNPVHESSDEDPNAQSGRNADPAVTRFLTSFHVTPAAKPA